jgi:uncharacterized protein (TIGR00369 family)
MCLVCGVDNALGLHSRFLVLDGGELLGVFRPREEHQSYPGRLHGGMVSAILDETIGRAVSMGEAQTWGVTVEFTVRFKKPVPLDGEVKAIGRITKDSSRIFEGTGEIILADGTVAAEAWGKYLKMPIEKIASAGFSEREWFPDGRSLPADIEVGDPGPE